MNTIEYIMKDLTTGKVGRYNFTFATADLLRDAINDDMLLTVEEMAEYVLGEFSQQEIKDFDSLDKNDLIKFHHTVGQDIRNAFGLWIQGNPNVKVDPDETSMEVLELMWNQLNNGGASSSTVMEFV